MTSHDKKTHFFLDGYELVSDGLTRCDRDASVTYTRDGADGWARTSLEECKAYCSANAVPEGASTAAAAATCTHVVWAENADWPPGWCHLASSCPQEASPGETQIWMKTSEQGK